jgi:hypothetical protein
MGGGAGGGAAATGMMGMMTAAAAALGVSVAALLGIILAVVAAIALMGLMIYKGVRLMQEGSDKAKLLGATLLLLTGPIGAFVLGMLMLAKPLKKFKDEAVKALMPVYDLLVKLKPILYVLGLMAATVFAPFLIPFGILYVLLPAIVGFLEGFAEVMVWAFEPFIPLAQELGTLFEWIAEKLGLMSGEGGGWQDTMKTIGKWIAYIVFGPAVALIKALTMVGDLIVMLATEAEWVGYALAWPFVWMWEKASEAFDWISDKFHWMVGQIISPILWIYNLWTETMMKISSAIRWITGPLQRVADAFWTIYSAVSGVKGALFGSSPWHVKESMEEEVIPALKETGRGFEGVAESAMGVHQVAKAKGGVVPKPRELAMAEMEAARIGAATPAPVPMPPGSPAESPSEINVSIPVTLTLDGMVVGKTVVETLINLRERHMNPPGFPLRGVEPAF